MDLPAVPRLSRQSPSSGEGEGKELILAKGGEGGRQEKSEENRMETNHDQRKRKHAFRNSYENRDENGCMRDVPEESPSRVSRRTSSRKVIDDEEDDADDEEEGDEDDEESEGSKSLSLPAPKRARKARAKSSSSDRSDSSSPLPSKKSKRSQGTGTTSDSASKDGDVGTDGVDTGMEEVVPGQNDILAQLEKEVENDDELDDFYSDSDIEQETAKKPERLTRRQRAMQGENVNLEYTKLESPKAKKKLSPEEDWSHDEEIELKRQQKARLRQMINEKRNKEKRAAMVDKVLRGVTSKRKKYTMASEARAAQVGTRLTQNEMREGCIRFISNRDGISLSLPKEVDEPVYLQASVKAAYPPVCKRDPRTGKRIFTEA